MATITFDDALDAELSQHVPTELRGEKKTTVRAHYVAREWLRERRSLESGSVSGGINGVKTQPGRDVSNPTNPS